MIRSRTILKNKILKYLREQSVPFQTIDGKIIIMMSDGTYHYCAIDVIGNSLQWYVNQKPFTFFVVHPKDTKDAIKAIDKYLADATEFSVKTGAQYGR